MQVRIIIYFIIVSFFLSCGIKSNQGETQNETTETETITGADNLIIYDSFEGLAPRLKTNSDTTFIINFWATWCKPCVAELPYFMKAAEVHKNDKVKFLYVSLDFKSQIDSKLRPFLNDGRLKGEVVAITDADFNSWIDKVAPEWQGSIPATLIFTKDKRVFFEQSFDYAELETEINKYLK